MRIATNICELRRYRSDKSTIWKRHQMETFSALLALWIPLTTASDAGFGCFLWSAPEKTVHPKLCNGCDYFSMLGLKLIHVSKRGPEGVQNNWYIDMFDRNWPVYMIKFCDMLYGNFYKILLWTNRNKNARNSIAHLCLNDKWQTYLYPDRAFQAHDIQTL